MLTKPFFFYLQFHWNLVESPPYIHKNSSRSNKLGGGVAMFLSDSLNFCIRDDLMCSCEDFECIFIEIQHEHGCNLIIGNVYRAPSTSVENFNKLFGDCLNVIAKEQKLCYIMGDFNLNFINCSDHQPPDNFVNTFCMYGFHPLIDKPTRILAPIVLHLSIIY